MGEIKPISIPGIHPRFLAFFTRRFPQKKIRVLDLAAGHGAFTKELHEKGFDVEACDLFPDHFYFDKVACKKADITRPLPYHDASFDAIVAMEVAEHIMDHEIFFRESHRALKKGGQLFVSTPNILSLKSRWRFFLQRIFLHIFSVGKKKLQWLAARLFDDSRPIQLYRDKIGFRRSRGQRG